MQHITELFNNYEWEILDSSKEKFEFINNKYESGHFTIEKKDDNIELSFPLKYSSNYNYLVSINEDYTELYDYIDNILMYLQE